MVMKYCARRGLYKSPEAYPWKSNACFWMVTGLYNMMLAQGLSESDLRIQCHGELGKMAARIQTNELTPPPRPQVEKLYVPVSTETALIGTYWADKGFAERKLKINWPLSFY